MDNYITIYEDDNFHLGHWFGTYQFQGGNDSSCWIFDPICDPYELSQLEEDMIKYSNLTIDKINKLINIVKYFIKIEKIMNKYIDNMK